MQTQIESYQCINCNMNLSKELLNNNDECYFCSKYSKKWSNRDYHKKEQELINILGFYKEKHKKDKYDCIVPLSGGKDSSYVLYLAVNKFGMRPLAVTFDNDFQTEIARRNIDNAVSTLNTGHITIAYDKDELRKMYSIFFNKTKNICTVCNHLINTSIFQTSEKEKISLILAGDVSKLELAPIYGNKRYCMEDIFLKVLEGEVDFDIKKFCNKHIRMNNNIEFITLFNYFDYDYNEVLRVLKNELGWSESDHGDAKVDCGFHQVISYFKYQNNGTSSAILMASSLLRDSKITKNEYNKRIHSVFSDFENMVENKKDAFFDYLSSSEETIKQNLSLLEYVEPVLKEGDFLVLEDLEANSQLEKIEALLRIIQPELDRDGSQIEIIDFKNDELIVLPNGSCKSCLQVDDTLIPWLEAIINKHVSENITVERLIRMK